MTRYELTVRGEHYSWHRTESGLERATRRFDRATKGTLLWTTLKHWVDGRLVSIGALNNNGPGIDWSSDSATI